MDRVGAPRGVNPLVAGSCLLATLLVTGALFTTPLISRDLTDRFSKYKRHSITLSMVCISTKEKSKKMF